MTRDSHRRRPSFPNSYWVEPGSFLAGEYPVAIPGWDTTDKLATLVQAGVNHFIDLTHSRDRLPPYSGRARAIGTKHQTVVAYERHPIRNGGLPETANDMVATLDSIDRALHDGRTVYLHCWGGVGRTGTVVGCWLVRHGHTGGSALLQLAQWWREVERSRRQPRSPETLAQDEYVRNWVEPDPYG